MQLQCWDLGGNEVPAGMDSQKQQASYDKLARVYDFLNNITISRDQTKERQRDEEILALQAVLSRAPGDKPTNDGSAGAANADEDIEEEPQSFPPTASDLDKAASYIEKSRRGNLSSEDFRIPVAPTPPPVDPDEVSEPHIVSHHRRLPRAVRRKKTDLAANKQLITDSFPSASRTSSSTSQDLSDTTDVEENLRTLAIYRPTPPISRSISCFTPPILAPSTSISMPPPDLRRAHLMSSTQGRERPRSRASLQKGKLRVPGKPGDSAAPARERTSLSSHPEKRPNPFTPKRRGSASPPLRARSNPYHVDASSDYDKQDDDESLRSQSPGSTTDAEGLQQRIEELSVELEALKTQLGDGSGAPIPSSGVYTDEETRWTHIFRIQDKSYLGRPSWDHGTRSGLYLRGTRPIWNTAKWMKQQRHILFVILNDYPFLHPSDYGVKIKDILDTSSPPPPFHQSILLRRSMVSAMERFARFYPSFNTVFPDFDFEQEIKAPYLVLFYMFPDWQEKASLLDNDHRHRIKALFTYMTREHGPCFELSLQRLGAGRISVDELKYLVKPGDVVVRPKPGLTAFMATSWMTCDDQIIRRKPSEHADAWEDSSYHESASSSEYSEDIIDPDVRHIMVRDRNQENGEQKRRSALRQGDGDMGQLWTVSGWNWMLQAGKLSRCHDVLDMRVNANANELFDVTSLEWYPLRYASQHVKDLLSKRGHTYWRCRERQFVGYAHQADGVDSLESVIIYPNSLPTKRHDRDLFLLTVCPAGR